MVDGKFDVAYLPPPADDVTSSYLYYLTNEKSKLSYARHTDKRLDDLWDRQKRERDPEQRKALIDDMERLMITENYYLRDRLVAADHRPEQEGQGLAFLRQPLLWAGPR